MPIPAAAPCCTSTWWPCSTSSRAPAGVSPTRYSWVLISFGTPIRTFASCNRGGVSLAYRQREAMQIRHVVGLDVDPQRRQHAHHGVVEGDGDGQVDDLFVAEFRLQHGKAGVGYVAIRGDLARRAQHLAGQRAELGRLAGAVVDQRLDVGLGDAEIEAE